MNPGNRTKGVGPVDLELFHCVFFGIDDDDQLVKLGDGEHFLDVGANVAKHKLAIGLFQLRVQGNDFAQSRGGKVLYIREVQNHFGSLFGINKLGKLFTNNLNVLFVENLLVDETDNGDVTLFFDFDATTTGLSGHEKYPLLYLDNARKDRQSWKSIRALGNYL
jgi:hypothetical protein